MIKSLDVGDKVKFSNSDSDTKLDTHIPVGSIGILTMKDNDIHLNHFVTFNDLGLSEWFKESELELVK